MRKILWTAVLLLPAHAWANMMLAPVGTTSVFPISGSAYAFTQPLNFTSFIITGDGLVYGWGEFNLGTNGIWSLASNSPRFAWFGTSSGARTVLIDLGQNYTSAGGFMNYNPSYAPYISALNTAMVILETYYLPDNNPIVVSGNDQGAFRGISRPTADIRFLLLSGADFAVHSLTVDLQDPGPDLPEPATFAMGALAILIAAAAARRRCR